MNQSPVLAHLRQLAPWALILLTVMVVVAAYLQALDYPFISDDVGFIATNTRLSTLPLAELWRLFSEPYNSASEFLPLRELSYWLDMTLFGLTPAAFRLHNIVLYLLCLPLVYGITLGLWRLFRAADNPVDAANASWAAAVVTALFALNPAHVEAVVWISGRKDILSGLFSLLALWLALRVKRDRGFSAPYAAATLLALLAAMLSKATAVAVAPVIALLWLIFWRDVPVPDRRRILLLWPLAGLLLAACVALVFASLVATRVPFYFGIEVVTRAFAILGWLARLSVSPENRHFIYHPVFEDTWLPAMAALGVVVAVLAVAGGAIILQKHSHYLRYSLEGCALVVLLLLCLPSLQLIPYAAPSLVSDRFVFLAVWPATLLVVALSWRLSPAPRAVLLLTIAFSWGIQTVERPRDWRGFEVLVAADWHAYPGNYILAFYKIFFASPQQDFYRHALETANSIAVPELREDMVRLVEADHAVRVSSASTGRPQEAVALLQQWSFDLRRLPTTQANWNLPIHNLWKRKEILLMREWEYLAEHFSDDEMVRYSAGLGLLELGRFDRAAVHLSAAIESQRLHEAVRGTAFYNLGLALLRSGQVVAAETPLRLALKQSPPELRAYCLLSVVYSQSGRHQEAAYARASCPDQQL